VSLADTKQTARRAAMNRRKAAFANASGDQTGPLRTVLRAYAGRTLSGYAPIRTEIDPTPAMAAHQGPVALPVVMGEGQPLRFRAWHPGCTMVTGPFGAAVPADGEWLVPEVLIVPLLAFDRQGGRLATAAGSTTGRWRSCAKAAKPSPSVSPLERRRRTICRSSPPTRRSTWS